MSGTDRKPVATTLEQEQALKVYIDALLLEPAPDVPPVQAPSVSEAPLDEPVPETVQVDTAQTVPTDAAHEAEPRVPAADSQTPFDCLLFKVAGGLKLCVPLKRLTGIMKWPAEITPLPRHADWFLGLVPHRGHQVKVIDIAEFVIPQHHRSRQALAGERRFQHLLLIDDGKIGLACDELGKVLKLRPEQVRWRSDTRTRPWLAGTVIEQMSALIDVDRFTAMLKEGAPLDEIP